MCGKMGTESQHGLLYCPFRPRFKEIMYHNNIIRYVLVLKASHGSECVSRHIPRKNILPNDWPIV